MKTGRIRRSFTDCRKALLGFTCCASGATAGLTEVCSRKRQARCEPARIWRAPGYTRRSGFILFLVWTCIVPALFGQQDVHAALIPPANRKAAPAFQLVTADGTKTQLSDYRGKVVLLNFWATDCGGCVLEIPAIIDLQAGYRDKGFTVVGVSMDIPYESLKDADEAWGKVKPFVAKKKINYPILMGRESLFKDFGLTQLPDTLLIDKAGKIAAVYVGIIGKANLEENITMLLSE